MIPQPPTIQPNRRIELDWLRVLAFGLLIFYHIGMYYVLDWHWHIKSQYQSQWLQNIMMWSSQWRMSLLFLISGCAVTFILQKVTLTSFFWSRHSRLLLPLVFGIFVVVVPQVYVEMASQGRLAGLNYWQFWVAYLNPNSDLFADNKTVGNLHLTWNHLWFLIYAFSYSILAWAIVALLKHFAVPNYWPSIETIVARPIAVFAIPLGLLYLNQANLAELHPETNNFVDDLFNHGRYLTAFLMGMVLVKAPAYWQAIKQWRWISLGLAVIGYLSLLYLSHGGSYSYPVLEDASHAATGWLWIVALCGWAGQLLNRGNAVLRYLNGGVFCYYIVHQTLIIVLAYYLAPLELGPVLEPICLILSTLAGCLLSYEVVRRLPVLPHVFGITVSPKPKLSGLGDTTSAAQ